MGRLLKLMKTPRNPRSILLAALLSGVGVLCIALVIRGTLRLRAPAHVGSRGALPASQNLAQPASRSTPVASVRALGEQVLTRNIFDSTTGPLAWELASTVGADDAGTSGDAGALASGGRCTGDLRLLASVVNGRDSRRSLVALRKDGKTHIVTMGEQLGELKLIALHATEAFFRVGESACSLPVYLSANAPPPTAVPPAVEPEPPPAPAVATTPSPLARARRPPAFSEEELKRNIRQLGPARYAVTRELFARARMNPSGISRGARFKPKLEEGRSAGMQVFRLRDDSLLSHLGVQQGDVLRGINGFSLGSADGVLEAMGHLGKNSKISLSIERGGALTTIEYVLE